MKNNRQILYLISNMYPSKTNIRYGVFVKNFKNSVNKKYRVKKIVLPKKYRLLDKIIGYIYLYFKIFRLLFTASSRNPIYVHAPLFMAPVLSLFCWSNKKLFLNFHGNDMLFDSFKKKILARFQICLVKKYPVIVPSSYFARKISDYYQKNIDEILVYPSGGIDTSVFYPDNTLRENNFTISFVSSFVSEKGWSVFLDAIARLVRQKTISDLKVIMVGDGPDKSLIQKQIKDLSLPVQLFSGLTHSQIARIYRQSDIFVFPTQYKGESLGLVGLEAMACGTPVIGSKHPALLTYLKDGENGLVFDVNKKTDLYLKILKYNNLSDDKKHRLRQAALQTAARYDSKKVQMELLNFLAKNQ